MKFIVEHKSGKVVKTISEGHIQRKDINRTFRANSNKRVEINGQWYTVDYIDESQIVNNKPTLVVRVNDTDALDGVGKDSLPGLVAHGVRGLYRLFN